MLHSKQWHYSLHRDFQNCYSTRRSPTGFFSSNCTIVPIHPHTTHTCTITLQYIQRILHPESNSTCRRQRALRVLLHTEGKGPSLQKRNSTHRRQGDLLEIHPCVLPDIPAISHTPETFQTFQSFMTFKPFQAILQVSVSPGNPPHSSILQSECIFYIFTIPTVRLVSTENSTEYQLNNYKHYILQRKGDVAISVKQDTILQNRIISPLRLVIKSC